MDFRGKKELQRLSPQRAIITLESFVVLSYGADLIGNKVMSTSGMVQKVFKK